MLALMVMSSLYWSCMFIVYILETDMFYMRQTNKRSSSFVNQLGMNGNYAFYHYMCLCLVVFVNGKNDTRKYLYKERMG